jgi:protein-disulfide isomerase-like protein with CxxC motif
MSYMEILKRALKERSVNQAAKDWQMQQVTLNRYVSGQRLPDYLTAKIIAEEAGISGAEMLDVLAKEEARMKKAKEKISKSFNWLLRVANVGYMRVVATA